MSDDIQTTVRRDDEKSRYEITLGGTVAGFANFRADERGRLVFDHTEIDPAFGGRGLGTTLVGEALADAAARGETVVPVCPFVVTYLRRHTVEGLEVHAMPAEDAADADTGRA